MEEFLKKMRKLAVCEEVTNALALYSYTDFDGRQKFGVDAIQEIGKDLASLNPNE